MKSRPTWYIIILLSWMSLVVRDMWTLTTG